MPFVLHAGDAWLPRYASRVLSFGKVISLAAGVAVALCPTVAAADEVSGTWISMISAPQFNPPREFTPGAYPHTGVSVFSDDGEEARQCTVSWPVVDSDNDNGYLTAGHCQNGGNATLWMHADLTKKGRTIDLPPLQDRQQFTDDKGAAHDSSMFYLPGGAKISDDSIAPGVTLRGVFTVAQARRLPKGTPLCMHGARSGLTCGAVIRAGTDELEWGGQAVHGDSGAPVFAVNADGDAMAVGMLAHGPTDTENYVTYLYPVLTENGLRVIIADD